MYGVQQLVSKSEVNMAKTRTNAGMSCCAIDTLVIPLYAGLGMKLNPA
jgi:hypothetical protein